MAFTDWDLHTQGTVVNITPNLITPLEGLQSLEIEKLSGSTQSGGAVVPSDASGLTKGLIAGRMRTQMKLVTGFLSSSGKAGIFFMMAAPSETPFTTTTVYYAGVDGLGRVGIVKHSSGITNNGTSLGLTANDYIADLSVAFTFEVVWFYDIPEFNGTRIIVSTGSSTDYSDLVPVPGLDVIDSTSPFSVTSGEGLAYATNGNTNMTWLFDRTELYSVSFV